eukprot:UN13375
MIHVQSHYTYFYRHIQFVLFSFQPSTHITTRYCIWITFWFIIDVNIIHNSSLSPYQQDQKTSVFCSVTCFISLPVWMSLSLYPPCFCDIQ